MNPITYLVILLLLCATFFQVSRIITNKSAVGLSRNVHIIGLVAGISIIYNSKTIDLYVIGIVDVLFALTFMGLITFYNLAENTTEEEKENPYFFWASLMSAFLVIFGVAQAIKCYQAKKKTTNVSIYSHLIFIIIGLLEIYLAEDSLIIVGTSISILVFIYIIHSSIEYSKIYIKN